jgi:ABC-type branched-subunit amino acid transport system ATPase component
MNPTETAELSRDIRAIRERGVTVLLIEHDMGLVHGVSDRVIALDYGTKIAEGRFEDVRENPAVLEAYLGRRGGRA